MLIEPHDAAGFRVGQTGIAEGSWVLRESGVYGRNPSTCSKIASA